MRFRGFGGASVAAGGGLLAANNLSDVASATTSATNLGLGTTNSPTFAGETITQAAATSGSPTGFTFTGGAHTTLTASTEAIDVNFNLARTVQFATGTLALQRAVVLASPTYSFVAASTLTRAITLDVTAPTAGTNATFTNTIGIRSQGQLVVMQQGGTAGTNEVQISSTASGGIVYQADVSSNLYVGTRANSIYFVVSATPTTIGNASVGAAGYKVSNSGTYVFSSGGDASSGGDTGFARLAAKVAKVTDASTALGWLQQVGRARVTADVTNATATMSSISDLSVSVIAGRKYFGEYTFFAADATAADGLAFDLNGGNATFTDLEFGFAAQPAGSTLGVVTSTAAGTAVTLSIVSTSDAVYTVSFAFTCNAAGTVIPRFAKASGSTGNATLRKQSHLLMEDSPN